jgi:hypothetical protein
MDSIPLLVFDIRGTNPVNTIPGEKIPLTDKTLNWTIPNGAPFFNEPGLLVVRNQAGGILTRDRDYFVEGEFVPFCEITGRSICSFIRVSDEILAANDFITVDYQSIGAWFVPRNDLQEWLDKMHEGSTPIPWSKVFFVPPTLPPQYHTHNIKTEIMDWYDFTYFFAQLEGIRSTRDPDFDDKLTAAVDDAYQKLYAARDEQLTRLQAHDKNYNNPHEADAFDIVMGNHDNYRTATLAEDLAGVKSDVLSTPHGVVALAKSYVPDTDKAMLSGIFPISSYSGESFLPPNISGSFEGMGQQTECSGICLEPSGLMMLLSNHNDGRTQGLYFSVVENYNKDNIRVTYSNYKYRPPALTALGIDVNRIIAGSGNKVIMTGVAGTDDWFICLTNGSFDPGAHAYVRCNMSAITAVFGSPYGNAPVFGHNDQATIHHMGAYLVLVQAYVSNGIGKSRFYRVRTADVVNGLGVTWEAIPLTYTDWDGNQFSGVLDYQAQQPILDGNGKIVRFGRFNLQQPATNAYILRRDLNLSWPQTGGGGNYYFHTVQFYHMTYYDRPVDPLFVQIMGGITEMYHLFNPANGVMSTQSKSPPISINFLSLAPDAGAQGLANYQHLYNTLVTYQQPSTVVLSTGELVTTMVFEGAAEFPCRLNVLKMQGVNSAEQLLSRMLDDTTRPVERQSVHTPRVQPATRNGVYSTTMTFEADGEVFGAADMSTPDLARKVFFRKVSGGYAIRDGVNNLTLGANIYSRPLTTEIYTTNLLRTDGMLGITGSGAELAAAGVDQGSGSASFCAYSSLYPASQHLPLCPQLRAPASGNVLVSFPRTYTKALDAINKVATYSATSFYGFRQNVIDQVHALTGNAAQWSFTVNHLGAENGGMFRGLNHSVVMVNWIVDGTGRFRSRVLIGVPVVEAPNADHPGIYLITGFNWVSAPADVSTCPWAVLQGNTQWHYLDTYYICKPMLTAYRDGNYIKISLVAGHAHVVATSNNVPICIFDLNLGNSQIENLAVGSLGRNLGDVAVMWPGVGMTDVSITDQSGFDGKLISQTLFPYTYTGGGAAIYLKTGVGYIVSTTVYPEVGWLLFIQDNIRMMVNGTSYSIQGGTIDLRDVDAAPQNKTFYMYATIEDETPKYLLSVTPLRKSGSMLRVATIVTNDKQILTITREQPFMVGDLLLSYTREGGTIPMSAGYPQDEGLFVFLHQAELLP